MLQSRLAAVRAEMIDACLACARDPAQVRLVAVGKFHPASAVQAVIDAGVADVGENRVQEAAEKAQSVRGAVWHMVGSLQRNKAAAAARLFHWIHSLDRPSIVEAVGRAASRRSQPLNVLVQVNLAGERQKGGCAPEDAADLLEMCRSFPLLRPRGLMLLPPAAEPPAPYFRELANMLQRLRRHFPDTALDQLSMGMSSDFREAIGAGATMVRIGTRIFGPRNV